MKIWRTSSTRELINWEIYMTEGKSKWMDETHQASKWTHAAPTEGWDMKHRCASSASPMEAPRWSQLQSATNAEIWQFIAVEMKIVARIARLHDHCEGQMLFGQDRVDLIKRWAENSKNSKKTFKKLQNFKKKNEWCVHKKTPLKDIRWRYFYITVVKWTSCWVMDEKLACAHVLH